MIDYSSFIGIPFVNNGRSLEGYDCWGLVKELYLQFHGEVLPDFVYEKATEDTVKMFFANELNVKQVWKKVEPQAGAIAVFSVAGRAAHVGFMINGHEFIHVISSSSTVIEDIKRLRWAGRFKGCYLWQPLPK